MDGIFVCYHNTAEIFGFQYLPRCEMDFCLYGNSHTGDAVFSLILQLYNVVLDEILSKYSREDNVLITFATDKTGKSMKIYSQVYNEKSKVVTDASRLLEYDLDIQSTVNNGVRSTFTLDSPSDVWQVTYNLKSRTPDRVAYSKIREEAKSDPIKKESALIREIRSKYLKPEGSEGKVFVGKWTHSYRTL